MSEQKQRGRPIIGSKKDIRLEIRLDLESLEKLDRLAKREGISRAEMIRRLISKA